MEDFEGRIAVVTGAGSGMGRELARQLAAEGCHVATCDISADNLAETKQLSEADARPGTRISTFVADVSDESVLRSFAVSVAADHDTDHINLLFNNAGIGGGGSFVLDERQEWERTFNICWGGVYLCTRTFMPMLLASSEGHVVNTSSVNGFWASLGRGIPHTAYSAAKFAVKGFTEALLTDFRLNAPHLRASVVMPGHIGTSIFINSGKVLGREPKEMTAEQVADLRLRLERGGIDVGAASDDDIRLGMQMRGEMFRDNAPTSAAQAATIILDGVRRNDWRILVGDDAIMLDELVREMPAQAYDQSFADILSERNGFNLGL
ncbi:MAG TPA: SDR family NAD(P)-dependent oxidoreductase [Ilumatobacteraceae bacterium]|jgi:NAD(P)-dependent dehydrogenase (short-subunit alcohol dehydrogenase family)